MKFVSGGTMATIALLACLSAQAAAPAGAWWDGNYSYRRQISIPAGGSALVTAYSLPVTFNHATEVAALRSLASGNDVRVVYWNGTTWIELDRIVDPDTAWNTATTRIWFETQAAIGSGVTDDNYYVYYGFTGSSTPNSTTPLQNADNIFLLYDDFPGAAIDAAKWAVTGTVTVATSAATVTNGSRLRSVATTFPVDTAWETRARMTTATPTGTFYYLAANSTGTANFGNYLRFAATNAATDTAQLSSGGSTAFTPTSSTTNQLYSLTREGAAGARFFQNGAVVATYAAGAPAGNFGVLLRNEATVAGQNQIYEWIRVRNYRNPEPAPTLGGQTTFTPVPVVAYSFEETSWNGTAAEVKDSGANALHGNAVNGATTANTSPAIAGASVGSCRYASLDGTNDYVRIPNSAALNMTTAFGIAAWVRHRTNTYKGWEAMITKGDSAYRLHLNGGCNIAGTLAGNTTNGLDEGMNSGCTTADLNTNQVPAANTWYHLGATFRNGEMRVYLNGALINSAAYSPPTIATNTYDLAFGENLQQPGRQWTGDIDEVTLWDQPVAQSTIQAHMAATHSCQIPHHFDITHDGYGINCAGETITVAVHDVVHNAVSTYNQQITLDTGSGKGDWTLVTGSGTLNNGSANDGIATYQWPLGESTATFSLSYKEGASSINISAYQTSLTTFRDDDTEGNLVWSPNGFTVTSAALSNPPPGTIPAFSSPQVAGNNFTLHLTAYGTTPTDAQCGVIEAYTGGKSLRFWSTYVNPASGTRVATINSGNIATVEGSAAAQAVTFTNGQASVTANYTDAGMIALNMKDATVTDPNLPTGIRGSTGNFVVRPSTFVLSNIRRTSDNFANPAAPNAAGTAFIAAGAPFAATVTAMESGGTATPNFGLETPAESVALTSALVLPVGGQIPAIAAATGFGAFSTGAASGNDFTWPEVGIITLTPHIRDGDYLGAGDMNGTTTGNVGRFIPANFLITGNTPVFQTACPAGAFTYIGQPFTYSTAPVLSVTARAVGGTTTRNYSGAFLKLTNTSINTRAYTVNTGALDQAGLPATTSDPAILDLTNGLASLTFSAGSGLAIARGTPAAPFNPQISLSVNVVDSDGVAPSVNPQTFTNIAFNAGSEQRYGRIAFRNAVGSELMNLPLPMRAEYFQSTSAGFTTNMPDSCTTAVTVAFANHGGNLGPTETCLVDTGLGGVSGIGCSVGGPIGQRFSKPPTGGDFIAIIGAPGAGNDGTVTLTTTVPTWLQYDWDASTPVLENPSGVATFGIFQGDSKRIFQTEK